MASKNVSQKQAASAAPSANAEIVAPVVTATSASVETPNASGAKTLQIVKKISNNHMKAVPIGGTLRVAGQVKKAVGKESTFGPYTQFVGDFVARIMGVTYKSHTLLLPSVADAELASQYGAALEQVAEGEDARIEFVFDLVKVKDANEKNVNGFQWEMQTVNAPAPESDKVLQMLETSVEKKPLTLQA